MIDVRELRIGNYVYDIGGKILRIDFFEHLQSGFDCKFGQRMFIGNEEVHPMTDYTDSVNPIPLTEQWLLDFGFENTQIGLFQIKVLSRGSINIHTNRRDIKFVELGTTGHYLFGEVNIKHVHQLQNLYFALTGQELTKK